MQIYHSPINKGKGTSIYWKWTVLGQNSANI